MDFSPFLKGNQYGNTSLYTLRFPRQKPVTISASNSSFLLTVLWAQHQSIITNNLQCLLVTKLPPSIPMTQQGKARTHCYPHTHGFSSYPLAYLPAESTRGKQRHQPLGPHAHSLSITRPHWSHAVIAACSPPRSRLLQVQNPSPQDGLAHQSAARAGCCSLPFQALLAGRSFPGLCARSRCSPAQGVAGG